jgi:hypothetical protein
LNFSRTTGSVTVQGPGAVLQINSGAGVNLGGSMDVLSDGTNNVSVVNNGTLSVTLGAKHAGGINGTGNTTVSGGVALTADHVIQNTLEIDGTGMVVIRSGGGSNGTSKVNALSIAGGTGAWTGTLAIGDNKLVLEAAGNKAQLMATTLDQLKTGASSGKGITTATLPANMGMAVVDNGALGTPKTTFGGVGVDSNSVLVGAEVLGDANIDGHVDTADLSTVLSHFGSATSAWSSGNFDGAATIDLTDLADVLNNFGTNNPNASDVTSGVPAAAPEPGSLAGAGIGVLVLAMRRRRA